MSNRYNQIEQFISFVKPKIFTEAGVDNFDLTEKLIKDCYKTTDELIYFAMAVNSKVEEYTHKLEKLKSNLTNFNYFVINLNSEVDLTTKYEVITRAGEQTEIVIQNTQFLFCNNLTDVNDFVTCVQTFQNTPCIIFDRFLQTDNEELAKRGCNLLLPKIKHLILPVTDSIFEEGDIINVQLVLTGPIMNNIQQGQSQDTNVPQQTPGQISIQTKNAVENEKIQYHVETNIKYARANGIKEIMPCQVHSGIAYMIGGAPSYKKPEKIKLLKKSLKEPGHYIFSSKTAINYLLENGIKPYGCILLDPREHIPSFVEKPAKDVIYFVASQCHPDTLRYLSMHGIRTYIYHAAVNAGEIDVLKRMKSPSPPVGGGSTSVTRGIGLLNIMGFNQFKLFGIDSSYPEKPERVHGFNQEKPSIEVNMSDSATNSNIGQKYWTDPELIAQANDIEMIMKNWYNIRLENHSEGMMKDMFDHLLKGRRLFKDFMKE